MEEEDAILGLAPASLPLQSETELEMTLPSVSETGEGRAGWSFEQALQTNNARHRGGSEGEKEEGENSDDDNDDDDDDDDDDESDAEEHDGHAKAKSGAEVVFRDGEAGGAAAASSSSRAADSGAGGDMDDDALLRIDDKKAAKRLGKKLYKRWKKLTKRAKKHKSSSKKESSSSKSKKSKKASKEKAKKAKDADKKKKKRSRSDDDDDFDESHLPIHMQGNMDVNELGLVPSMDLSTAAADVEARLHKAVLREAKMRTEKATKKAAQQKSSSAEVLGIAKELVAAMATARKLDDDIVHGRSTKPGVFPLHRVALRDLVEARCRQAFMVGPLVESGILQELSYWLYDVDRGEAAPYELRTVTLNILLTFPLERSVATTEDLTQFNGITREHLIHTDIGRALNAVRRYSDETVDNRGKCVQLLTSFSRVISGAMERDETDENKSKAVWKCQKDPSVASPFAALETGSEALQKSFMKPDPRDPTSYNRLLPWRGPAATITNVSGTLNSYIEKALPTRR